MIEGRLALAFLFACCPAAIAEHFDAAPFALPLRESSGLQWEDPRELHSVAVEFTGSVPAAESVRLEYWGSRWPEQHLPKQQEPGGGDVGWMELGNWYNGGWRVADTEVKLAGQTLTFTFHPVNAKEFPKLGNYAAPFRYTLKLRLTSDAPLPPIKQLRAFTDSTCNTNLARLAWKKPPRANLKIEAFNGQVLSVEKPSAREHLVRFVAASNPDPNTFDKTLVTVRNGQDVFTFASGDVKQGLLLPAYGVAVVAVDDARDYESVAAAQRASGGKTLYERVAELPEQTWKSAWDNIPPKKSPIYFPLSLDGGRQKFLLEPDGTVRFRCNDHFLQNRPGAETPRFALEASPARFRFGPSQKLQRRSLQDSTLPVCTSVWDDEGLGISQTAFVTSLEGTQAAAPPPPGDALAVFMARFVFTNSTESPRTARLPVTYRAGNDEKPLRASADGLLRLGEHLRAQVLTDGACSVQGTTWKWDLKPHGTAMAVVKIPYVVLTSDSEYDSLKRLDFETERQSVAAWWRQREEAGARLLTPEPILNDFYLSHARHLQVNCEREPGSTRRFARVGSFAYGAYGNESCMMVVDLDRRGYHREAQECLDAWLHYQGTVGLPGDFASKEGVLYGAGGYEAGGYNQHHGWILWMLAEHYRFTRDGEWLRSAAPGIVAAADWLLTETRRTANRHELERGLLPAGSLEDIGDWWTWLSTSCYSWRGLDSAAWALEQLRHPEAKRIRREADAFRVNLLANFRQASQRSPVVRLRDGTAVPQIPSHVHRRGRSFGWICQTLEGAIHLLITGALDPRSPEAEWILKDYEDNLFLSNQYGYTLENFERDWFGRGGMSMQACLLLDVEPYLYRDDVKHALRATFNAIAVSHFPDVHMNTEHALPNMDDWRGDHFKSSDEANACGWLRQLFVRESGKDLVVGQAVPRNWLEAGRQCGIERAATYFGPMSVRYRGGSGEIRAALEAPTRNPPAQVRLRFRVPGEKAITSVLVNGKPWKKLEGDWVILPGKIGKAEVVAQY